jgi:predicted Zn-ribbon and HTH transcriptional regulator
MHLNSSYGGMKLHLSHNMNHHKSHNTNQITEINKLIDLQKNDICPITLEYFIPNCTYAVCNSCSYNYDYMALENWLKYNNICPICKTKWINKIKYINMK